MVSAVLRETAQQGAIRNRTFHVLPILRVYRIIQAGLVKISQRYQEFYLTTLETRPHV